MALSAGCEPAARLLRRPRIPVPHVTVYPHLLLIVGMPEIILPVYEFHTGNLFFYFSSHAVSPE